MAANVDQALVIFAVHEPEPNFHLLNRFLITMEQQEIPVIICFNKTDLATTEQMQQLEKDYENSGCQVIFRAAATGEGITQITPSWQDNNYGRPVWCREIFYFKLY